MAIISQYQAVISGQLISAALWNGMELNIINNGLIPAGIEDYSTTDAEMQTQTDPYPSAVISRATSAAGELERLRYQIAAITGETYWYIDPDTTLAGALSHTHESPYTQIPTAGIADSAVTTAKIADANVTTAKIADANVTTAKIADSNVTTAKIADSNVTTNKIADSNVTTAKIADANVTEAKISTSIAGNGLSGGGGSALSVNVDNSTLEINSDTLRVKDAGITESKLETAVVNKLGQNIGLVARAYLSQSNSVTTYQAVVNYTGQGRLMGITTGLGATVCSIRITIDGVSSEITNLTLGGLSSISFAGHGTTTFVSSFGENSLTSLNCFFKTSLLVEIKANSAGGGSHSCTVQYERQA